MKKIVWLVAATGVVSLAAAVAVGVSAAGSLAAVVSNPSMQYLLLVPVPFLTAGIWLLVRHPEHRIGWLLTTAAATTMAYAALLEQIVKSSTDGLPGWVAVALAAEGPVSMAGLACLALLIALFPDGSPRVHREQVFSRMVWFLPVPMLLSVLSNEHVPLELVTYAAMDPVPNPFHLEWLAPLGAATRPMRYLLGLVLIVAVGMLILRYREVASQERRQIRWVLFGSAAAVSIGIIPFILEPVLSPDSVVHDGLVFLSTAALLLLPASIVVAVEEPRWIDIDELIRKSFIYGALTVGIFVAYAAVAAGLGLAAGARFPIEVAIVLTAALAFLVQPTRTRLQLVADRLVFGARPSPIEAVTGFEQAVRTAEEPNEIGRHLAELVRTAARLHWAVVELTPDPPHVAGRELGDPVLRVVIQHQDEVFGEIRCGPRVAGALGDRDSELVQALAVQAGLMISNMRLAGRIVQAQEAERRRIERNIHDGAQQELVALVAKLGLARTRARTGALDESTLVELQSDARTILRDLREFAQGIHPSVLTDGGIVEAIEDRCGRIPIDVVVDASLEVRSSRFEDDVEGAAYFLITEALANVLKHSRAQRVRIGLVCSVTHLDMSVEDDGAGFVPADVRLRGLAGLGDRFAALGGSVSIDSRPGRGTVIGGRLPATSRRSR
ncbi:MAG TPA: histidine kinase [Acidimicrobiia bacterium]|nr:histidine kinase [Acidimicrobiia bacterium]